MYKLIKTILVYFSFLGVFASASCTKEPVNEEPVYLEVNANNISGNWSLAAWNGSELKEGTFMYVNFVRNDKTFTIWSNMDSFSDIPHKSTGEFSIVEDEEFGAVIMGKYDYDSGFWSHDYVVMDLTDSEMTWVAKDNPDFIQHFVRVESIPFVSE